MSSSSPSSPSSSPPRSSRARRDLAVATGALAGAGLRWLALSLAAAVPAAGVLVVNLLGTTVLGALSARTSRRPRRDVDALVGAGFCGALTTWSTLAVQVGGDLRGGRWAAAGGWLAANLVLGVAAAVLARWFGARALGGRR